MRKARMKRQEPVVANGTTSVQVMDAKVADLVARMPHVVARTTQDAKVATTRKMLMTATSTIMRMTIRWSCHLKLWTMLCRLLKAIKILLQLILR